MSDTQPDGLPLDPQTWSKDDLQKWILSLKKKYSYKAWFEKVQPERYANWTGKVICAISREIFLAFEKGMAGEFMFEDLHKRRRIAEEFCPPFKTGRRESSMAELPSSHGPHIDINDADDYRKRSSMDFPPDRDQLRQRQLGGGMDNNPIRRAHIDRYKEDFIQLDQFVSDILEYGEMPDSDHYYTDSKRVLSAIFNLYPKMGKNYSSSLEPLLTDILQEPLFHTATNDEFPVSGEFTLSSGQICLVVDVDIVMASLLKDHYCKGTKQGETTLNSSFSLKPHIGRLIHSEAGEIVRPPPVLLITTCAIEKTPSQLKPPPSGAQRESNESGIGEETSLSPECKPPDGRHSGSRLSGLGSSGRPVDWKSEVSNYGTKILSYSYYHTSELDWNPYLTLNVVANGSTRFPVTLKDASSISLEVINPWPFATAFSLRVYSLNRPYHPEILFPVNGLQVLNERETWRTEAEVHCQENDWIFLEVLVCEASPKKQWNIQRHPIIYKTQKGLHIPKMAPLDSNQKTENLKAVVGWCMFYLLNKEMDIPKACTIFTQALKLPDFHRPELRAFIIAGLCQLAKSLFKMTGQKQFLESLIAFHRNSSELLKASRMSQNPRMVNLCQLTEHTLETIGIDHLIKKIPKAKSQHILFKTLEKVAVVEGVKNKLNENCDLFIPKGCVDYRINLQVATVKREEMAHKMQSRGQNEVVHVISCIQLETESNQLVVLKPYEITATFPNPLKGLSVQYLVMTAKDLHGPWCDSTESFEIQITKKSDNDSIVEAQIKGRHLGWIVPIAVEWRPTTIAKQAFVDMVREEPVMLSIRIFISTESTRKSCRQIVVLITNADNVLQTALMPFNSLYQQIGETRSFQSIVGKQLIVELQGNFSPDNPQELLKQEFHVPDAGEIVMEKWVCIENESSALRGEVKICEFNEDRQVECVSIVLDTFK